MEKLVWHAVRDDVVRVNPQLARIIDQLDPGPEYNFFRARYSFGARILDNGTINIPDQYGKLRPLHDKSQNHSIVYQLSYSPIPVGLIIKNSLETFVEPNGRMVPLKLFVPGEMLGLWETLEPPTFGFAKRAWSITAGARSIFMLPKITSFTAHARLRREYGITLSVPKTLSDHWQIFAEIANHKNFNSPWYAELLFFSAKWFEKKFDDLGWLSFHHYLLQYAWGQSLGCRNKEILDYVWESYSLALANKNLKPNPLLVDTVKHLIRIGIGASPGFRPAGANDLIGPILALQDAYVDIYGLKPYAPIIMQPYHLSEQDTWAPVYYSLQSPSLPEYYPRAKKNLSIIADLCELKMLTDTLQQEFNLETTPIYNFLKNVKYDYFHSETGSDREIFPSGKILQMDSAFSPSQKYKNREFSDTSPFIRGCVRISLCDK